MTEADPELRDLLELEIETQSGNLLTSPIAFYGEHTADRHVNHGEASNELTVEQFRPVTFA